MKGLYMQNSYEKITSESIDEIKYKYTEKSINELFVSTLLVCKIFG